MTENNHNQLNEQDRKKREELFRYTDLSHPVIKILFDLASEEINPKSNMDKG